MNGLLITFQETQKQVVQFPAGTYWYGSTLFMTETVLHMVGINMLNANCISLYECVFKKNSAYCV